MLLLQFEGVWLRNLEEFTWVWELTFDLLWTWQLDKFLSRKQVARAGAGGAWRRWSYAQNIELAVDAFFLRS